MVLDTQSYQDAYMQTKFGITTSNNVGVMLRAQLYQKRGQS